MSYRKFCHQGTLRCEDDPASLHYRYSSYGAATPLCCASHLVDILFAATAIFEESGIPSFILWGTHLGALRHRGIIPWDTDVDIGIFEQDYDRVRALAPRFAERGLCLRDTPGQQLLTLYFSETNTLHMDIEVWGRQGPSFVWQTYSIAEGDMLPLRKVPFYDRQIDAPRATPYLLDYYGADCLAYGRKQWVGWKTRLWKHGFTDRFELSHRLPAPIDLGRDYEAESGDVGLPLRVYARLADRLRLWKLRTYWATLRG